MGVFIVRQRRALSAQPPCFARSSHGRFVNRPYKGECANRRGESRFARFLFTIVIRLPQCMHFPVGGLLPPRFIYATWRWLHLIRRAVARHLPLEGKAHRSRTVRSFLRKPFTNRQKRGILLLPNKFHISKSVGIPFFFDKGRILPFFVMHNNIVNLVKAQIPSGYCVRISLSFA